MGRLDVGIKGVVVEEGGVDDLDSLEPVDILGVVEESLKGVPAGFIIKSPRRRLEDRMEELRLRHEIQDYDFDI